jgi:hypothetical protein
MVRSKKQNFGTNHAIQVFIFLTLKLERFLIFFSKINFYLIKVTMINKTL